MRKLLQRRDDFTALFVIADSMAMAAMRALHDGDKRVPADVSVIAIDGIPMSAYTVPALTTLVQPTKEMGEEPIRILMDMIEGKAKANPSLEDMWESFFWACEADKVIKSKL